VITVEEVHRVQSILDKSLGPLLVRTEGTAEGKALDASLSPKLGLVLALGAILGETLNTSLGVEEAVKLGLALV
tara:strand:+ start:146 stop:367 length:222 start_codon:yes stop_codon:yes gene_type:complete